MKKYVKERVESAMKGLVKFVTTPKGMFACAVAVTLWLLVWLLWGDAGDGAMMAVVVPGIAGGTGVTGEPLTTTLTESVSPGLLRNEIDDRIVKVRPMATPIDQISRYGGSRLCGSMVVDYYSIDTRKISSRVAVAVASQSTGSPGGRITNRIEVEDDNMFEATETLLLPGVKASENGSPSGSLVLYVVAREDTRRYRVMAVNNTNEKGAYCMPEVPAGAEVVRMGRAAAELDVQTAQFEAAPRRERNYCQIFKAQVEQSTLMKIANKEVGWTFNDQEEAAVIDMRMGMEKNFIFGVKSRFESGNGDEVMLTGGIWNQINKSYEYDASVSLDESITAICRAAFTGNGGSSRKVLVGGSGFIERLNNMSHNKVVKATDRVVLWGLDFNEVVTKFGTLYVIMSETFDQCGHADDAMIIDPEYITKYCHVPFRTERLDLRSAGVRNTDAIVITEASCLVLRYPDSHLKIVKAVD